MDIKMSIKTKMKNWILFMGLIVVLSSCDVPKEESPTCHKGIYIENRSDVPIKVRRLWLAEASEITYFMRIESNKKIIYPEDSTFRELDYYGCLEGKIDWLLSHPGTSDPDLRTIYICDTVTPSQTVYSTPDSVLMQYNILKEINLRDSSVASLRKKNFILQYP